MISYRSSFLSPLSGIDCGRPLVSGRKRLRFIARGLQCCFGVNEQSRAAKARAPLPRDCSHLGRQTERETVPVTPECPVLITGRLNFLLPVVSHLNLRRRSLKSSAALLSCLYSLDAL